jgi:CheY-like chemotaxis protein
MERKRLTPVVLVVDDDEDWRSFAQEVLEPDYTVEVAASGKEALAAVRNHAPDLIILDVMMPGGLDGFGTLCELRKNAATRAIPVIMLTGVNAAMGTRFDREELERYLGVAPSAFLEKPIPPADLIAEVARLLSA